MEKKTVKYVSHDIQNEVLKVMAQSVLRENFRLASFSVMADECTDQSNREQLAICIRWIGEELEPQEDVIGLYKIDDISANTVVEVILIKNIHSSV